MEIIKNLECKNNDYLWGTIHKDNVASKKVAEKCGRSAMESYWFHELI